MLQQDLFGTVGLPSGTSEGTNFPEKCEKTPALELSEGNESSFD